ncbi:MAG: 2Fe-2S iron-sulfur cluster-binding protein [Rubrivivax sp.]
MPSERQLRLASGLVMFAYLAVHFVDHALGLVSLDVAEVALAASVAVWQSLPGTLLLYGAAAVHVLLALHAVYRRRTLRMPPMQALRLVLGFGMPILLIGHVVATRMAVELHGLAPTYHRIVWALWLSDSEGRQLALQAPGWVHGCLGLQFAFGHRGWWQRARPVLFGAAILLPVLSALGFLSMGRELAALAADPALLARIPKADVPQQLAIGTLRDDVLLAWFGLIAAVFAAREVRGWLERRRGLLVPLAYPGRAVESPRGWSVLETSRSFGIPHLAVCGGQGRCSTCRVRVVEGLEALPPPSEVERRTLARIGAGPDVRLACQLRPTAGVMVEPLCAPGGDGIETAEAAVVEHDAALLLVRVARWSCPRGGAPSPHDLVYALNQVFAVVGEAVQRTGGALGPADNDGIGALFDGGAERAAKLQRAWQAAAAIEAAWPALQARLARELGLDAQLAMALHAGPLAVGPLGVGAARLRRPVGATVREAFELRDAAAAQGARLAVSRAAAGARLAGFDEWQTVGAVEAALLQSVAEGLSSRP